MPRNLKIKIVVGASRVSMITNITKKKKYTIKLNRYCSITFIKWTAEGLQKTNNN